MKSKKPILGITLGELTGIGPEIVAKSLIIDEIYSICHPIVFGCQNTFKKSMEECELNKELKNVDTQGLKRFDWNHSTQVVPFFHCPGDSQEEITLQAIHLCSDLCLEKVLDGMVTGPVDKYKLQKVFPKGSSFIGHTEYLKEITKSDAVAMMLAGDELRVVPVTTHCSIREVPELLTLQRIFQTIELTALFLKESFQIGDPKIAVCALNPHAGENGIFGREEGEIILPAVEKARLMGIDVQGPLPSDTVFFQAVHKRCFDAIITMYHDQALIPLKMLYFHRAVNITLGLPIVRTSVDHGTAYEIVGKNQADPSSMVEAIRMAAYLCRI